MLKQFANWFKYSVLGQEIEAPEFPQSPREGDIFHHPNGWTYIYVSPRNLGGRWEDRVTVKPGELFVDDVNGTVLVWTGVRWEAIIGDYNEN